MNAMWRRISAALDEWVQQQLANQLIVWQSGSPSVDCSALGSVLASRIIILSAIKVCSYRLVLRPKRRKITLTASSGPITELRCLLVHRCFFYVLLRLRDWAGAVILCCVRYEIGWWFMHSGIDFMLELACFSQVEKLCLFKPMQSCQP
jgi:hypothetical protein